MAIDWNDTARQNLLEKAWQAAENAYCVYSHFRVGAAVLGADGHIYTGCNVENRSYGLTNCAERTAVFSMVAAGCQKIEAIAVVAKGPQITPPCGACRQVITEFCAGPETPVLMSNGPKTLEMSVQELLPLCFTELAPND